MFFRFGSFCSDCLFVGFFRVRLTFLLFSFSSLLVIGLVFVFRRSLFVFLTFFSHSPRNIDSINISSSSKEVRHNGRHEQPTHYIALLPPPL